MSTETQDAGTLVNLGHAEFVKAMLASCNPSAVLFDNCDAALIGCMWLVREGKMRCVAVYSYEDLVDDFLDKSDPYGEDLDEGELRFQAEEYVDFNIAGAYVGPDTPVVVGNTQTWRMVGA